MCIIYIYIKCMYVCMYVCFIYVSCMYVCIIYVPYNIIFMYSKGPKFCQILNIFLLRCMKQKRICWIFIFALIEYIISTGSDHCDCKLQIYAECFFFLFLLYFPTMLKLLVVIQYICDEQKKNEIDVKYRKETTIFSRKQCI